MSYELMDVEGLHAHLKEATRTVGRCFTRPDDDWQAMIHIVSRSGRVDLSPLDGDFFASQQSKMMLVEEVFPAMVKEFDLTTFGLVLSTWALEIPKPPGGWKPGDPWTELPLPSGHPDRVEKLTVSSVSEERMLMSWATILRHDNNPPHLAEWEDLDIGGDEGARATGIFGDLTRVFKEA